MVNKYDEVIKMIESEDSLPKELKTPLMMIIEYLKHDAYILDEIIDYLDSENLNIMEAAEYIEGCDDPLSRFNFISGRSRELNNITNFVVNKIEEVTEKENE